MLQKHNLSRCKIEQILNDKLFYCLKKSYSRNYSMMIAKRIVEIQHYDFQIDIVVVSIKIPNETHLFNALPAKKNILQICEL